MTKRSLIDPSSVPSHDLMELDQKISLMDRGIIPLKTATSISHYCRHNMHVSYQKKRLFTPQIIWMRKGLEVITSPGITYVCVSLRSLNHLCRKLSPFVTEPNLSNMTGLLAAAESSIALSEPFDNHSSFFSVPDDL